MALLTFKLKGMEGHATRSADKMIMGDYSSIWTIGKHPVMQVPAPCNEGNETMEIDSSPTLVNGAVYEFCKFFPYDDGNGNPIYDENTGKELRDPVTCLPFNNQ